MTGATSTKEDITLNGFNHITAEMFEHTLSLEEHDENAKDFSLPGNQILIYHRIFLEHEQNIQLIMYQTFHSN